MLSHDRSALVDGQADQTINRRKERARGQETTQSLRDLHLQWTHAARGEKLRHSRLSGARSASPFGDYVSRELSLVIGEVRSRDFLAGASLSRSMS